MISRALPGAGQFPGHRFRKSNINAAKCAQLFTVEHDRSIGMPVEYQRNDQRGEIVLIFKANVIGVFADVVDDLSFSLPNGPSDCANRYALAVS